MRLLALLFALLAMSCGDGPIIGGDPGDDGAVNWDESSVPECEEWTAGDCSASIVKESCVEFTGCNYDGLVRVYGPAQTANSIDAEWSRSTDYVSDVRALAPHHVRFVDCNWSLDAARMALYIGPGVSFLEVIDSSFSGTTSSAVVYLGAESTRVTIADSDFDVDAGREVIAVDASDHFMINDNRIRGQLGVFTYRNCGQNGVTRQTTPSDGGIVRNRFDDDSLAVWLSSRDAKTKLQAVSGTGYCTEDNGTPIGSSGSDLDWSRRNVVNRNTGGHYWQGYSASGNWGNNL